MAELSGPLQKRTNFLEDFVDHHVIAGQQAQLKTVFPNLLDGTPNVFHYAVLNPEIREHVVYVSEKEGFIL
ncbi:MAG: hypothetical protein HY646_17330 [Acidobacteria bacterium]|nr:hypothetical protein [Acidobacteriota bacterium]